jgi:16S rRNA G527 N7-methylase RsmG
MLNERTTMNERIKELAVQAGFYANPDVEKFEKFAELIVRECAYINLKSPFQDGEFHAREVLEHFGVE